MSTKLDTREARTDLTSRECSKLLGATIGGLVQMATPHDVKTAIQWWAEHFDEAKPLWEALGRPVGNKPI